MRLEKTAGWRRSFVILGTLAATGCGGPATGELRADAAAQAAQSRDEAQPTIVTGQGDATKDLPAVQAAVSAGGRVKLVGTFDFGADGKVVITRDVAISGGDGATVKGGRMSFYSPLPGAVAPAVPGPAISIQNLTFDGPLWTPIHVAYARSASIRHNRIRNVKPWQPPGLAFAIQGGILVTTYFQSANKTLVFPGALTGEIEIRGNELDMTGPAPLGTVCQGINVVRAWGASIAVEGNTVLECSRSSIELIDNHLDERGKGHVLITRNRIQTATSGIGWPTPQTPDGIVAGWFYDITGATDPARNPRYHVVQNWIDARGVDATGIYSSSAGALLEGNRISLGGERAYGIATSAPETRLTGNVVTGEGLWAFGVFAYPPVPSLVPTGVTSTCDRVREFTARNTAGLDFLLKGNHNTVIGFNGTVLDGGTDNRILALRDADGGRGREGDCGRSGDDDPEDHHDHE
jgi:hypothetical protein